MNLDDFLSRFIEGYLFHDLETMASASPPGQDGHLGFPMLMSAVAGIEMLGALCNPNQFLPTPAENFSRYWERYLYIASPQREAGSAIYQLVRHGIAHNFAPKRCFIVTKCRGPHLVNIGADTHIDAAQLFDDLRNSYIMRFRPVASGKPSVPSAESRATIQSRLNEIINYNEEKIKVHHPPLAKLPQLALAGNLVQGASAGLGPIQPTPASSSSLG